MHNPIYKCKPAHTHIHTSAEQSAQLPFCGRRKLLANDQKEKRYPATAFPSALLLPSGGCSSFIVSSDDNRLAVDRPNGVETSRADHDQRTEATRLLGGMSRIHHQKRIWSDVVWQWCVATSSRFSVRLDLMYMWKYRWWFWEHRWARGACALLRQRLLRPKSLLHEEKAVATRCSHRVCLYSKNILISMWRTLEYHRKGRDKNTHMYIKRGDRSPPQVRGPELATPGAAWKTSSKTPSRFLISSSDGPWW